ncbi:MAG: aldo/keto reductase [Verrucomicrobiales bacterium]|nr:aldo/keto reductase [Verrucomicrobiales bacterium]
MERIALSENGPEVSRLVYGSWRILDDPSSANVDDLLRRLHACVDLGITTIDTAEIYGGYKVEEFLGETLRKDPGLRDRLEIVTKCGIYVPCEFHPERHVAFYDVTAERIVKSAEKSLKLLGVETLDVLLVHRPDWLTSIDDTAEGLNRLLKDGKIRAAGVSNYSVDQFEALNSRMDQPLVTNQVEFSLMHMDPIFDGVTDQCQRLKVRPMAWSPLGGGRLFSHSDEAAIRLHAKAAKLGVKYDMASIDQLAYAWILAHPSRPIPVIGTNKMDRLTATAKAASIQLEREDWYALWEAAKGHSIP